MGTSSGFHFNNQSSMLPPRQQLQPGGVLPTSLSLVAPDACGSPNLQEHGSNYGLVRESPTESASSRETWPTAEALTAKKLDKEKERENGFAGHSVVRHISNADKMSLRDVASERNDVDLVHEIEAVVGKQLEKFECEEKEVLEDNITKNLPAMRRRMKICRPLFLYEI